MHGFNTTTQLTLTINELKSCNAGNISYLKDCLTYNFVTPEEINFMKKKTLVIGASTNRSRFSNIAINRLVSHNMPTVAIGLREGEVAGIPIETKKIPFEDVDTVTLYLGPPRQEEYYEYIVSLHPKRVIFNPGTENREFYRLLEREKIEVEVACTLVLLSTNQY